MNPKEQQFADIFSESYTTHKDWTLEALEHAIREYEEATFKAKAEYQGLLQARADRRRRE